MADTLSGSADGRHRPDVSEASEPVTPDTAFEALADPQRRAVLRCLADRPDGSAPVETLVHRVASRDGRDSATAHRRVAASLVDVHLPKLDDWGLVEYHRERRTVRYTGSALVSGLLARATESGAG